MVQRSRHAVRPLIAVIAVLLVGTTEARADIGRRLFRGITYAMSPSIGTIQNGPLPDNNVFRQHFIYNIPGRGIGYEFTRTFGTDSFGNAQQLDAGPVNMALQGQIHNRIVLNRAIIPEINIQSDTGGAALNYNLNVFTGAQNLGLQGSFTGNITGTLNALGFYNLQVIGNNTGTRTADGMVYTDDQSTNFDLGPVNVSGNIFLDIAAGFFQATLNSLAASEFSIPSSAAARVVTPDNGVSAVLSASSAGTPPVDLNQLIGQALVQSMFAEALADLSSAEAMSLDSLIASLLPELTDGNGGLASAQAPEPATLLLLGLPALALLPRAGGRRHSRSPQ